MQQIYLYHTNMISQDRMLGDHGVLHTIIGVCESASAIMRDELCIHM